MMENKEAIIKEAEESVLHTYNRYQVVLDHGDGVYLYDTDGKNIWISRQASRYRPWVIITRATTRR